MYRLTWLGCKGSLRNPFGSLAFLLVGRGSLVLEPVLVLLRVTVCGWVPDRSTCIGSALASKRGVEDQPPLSADASVVFLSSQLLGVVGVVVVIATAIPILTLFMIPVLILTYYFANRYLQVRAERV